MYNLPWLELRRRNRIWWLGCLTFCFGIRKKLKWNRFCNFLKPRPTNGGSNVQFDRERLAASDWSPNARCTLPLKYYDVLFVGPGIEFGLHRVVGWQKVGGNRRQINPPPQEEEEEEEKKRIIIWNKKKKIKSRRFVGLKSQSQVRRFVAAAFCDDLISIRMSPV